MATQTATTITPFEDNIAGAIEAERMLTEGTLDLLRKVATDKNLSDAGRTAAEDEALRVYSDNVASIDATIDNKLDKAEEGARADLAIATRTNPTERLEQRMLIDSYARSMTPTELFTKLLQVLDHGANVAEVWAEEVPLRIRAAANATKDPAAGSALLALAETARQTAEDYYDRANPKRDQAKLALAAIEDARNRLAAERMKRAAKAGLHPAFGRLPGHTMGDLGRWVRQGKVLV